MPNDIYCHRYNLKLCSKNAQIRNLDFQKGLLGDIMQGLAIERGLLAYIGFHALVCRDGPPDKGEINKQKLYGLRNETDHGFDRFASDFNNGIIWHLQNEWYKNHDSIVALHNFLNMVFNQVLGSKTKRDPLSPIREFIFAAKPLERMNGTYEKGQLNLLIELKNFVTKQIRFNHPKVMETFYSYRPYVNNRGIFVEIDIYLCCQFQLLDGIMHNMLSARKNTYFNKLFSKETPLGIDLMTFYSSHISHGIGEFGKTHPSDLLKTEREIGFMSIEKQKELVQKDDFTSSDDENLFSPLNSKSTNKRATSSVQEHRFETPTRTARKRKRGL